MTRTNGKSAEGKGDIDGNSNLYPMGTPPAQESFQFHRPNWRDPKAYQFTSPQQLAWELLRRNQYFHRACVEAIGSERKRQEVCLTWGLMAFRDPGQSVDSGDTVFLPVTPPEALAKLQKGTLKVARKGADTLSLQVDLSKLGDDQNVKAERIRTLIAAIEQQIGEASSLDSNSPGAWISKVPRHLRLIDAMHPSNPATRQEIGEKFHREGAILVQQHYARTEAEIRAAAKTRFPARLYNDKGHEVDVVVEAEIAQQHEIRKRLALKYSRAIGAQIAVAHVLLFKRGYLEVARLVPQSLSIAARYNKVRQPPADGALFKNRKLNPKSSSWA